MSADPEAEPVLDAELFEPISIDEAPLPKAASPLAFLALGLSQGVAFALTWSAFMAMSQGRPYLSVLSGAGLAAGILFGIAMSIANAFTLRPSSFTIPVPSRAGFLVKIGREMKKLRYKPEVRTASLLTYRSGGVLPIAGFQVEVRIGDGSARVAGPSGVLSAVKKRLAAD